MVDDRAFKKFIFLMAAAPRLTPYLERRLRDLDACREAILWALTQLNLIVGEDERAVEARERWMGVIRAVHRRELEIQAEIDTYAE
jgi:hypothetical protein